MADLSRLEIRIKAHDERLRYSSRSAMTRDILQVLHAHKGELLYLAQQLDAKACS